MVLILFGIFLGKSEHGACIIKNPVKTGLVEAPVGFEPTNKAFAELPLKPLGYSAIKK